MNDYTPETKKKPTFILGLRASAIVETIGMLVILALIDAFLLGGHRFWDMNPHPFWIVVLLIASQYGTNEGLFAAAVATCLYLLGHVPPESENLSHYDRLYAITINPVLWFVVGWILGELRSRHVRERDRLETEIADSKQREEVIADSYRFVRNRKEALEVQLSGQLASTVEAYRAAKSVEALDPKSVMQGVERLIKSVLGPQKFSLYLLNDSRLSATLLHGWTATDSYAQTIDPVSGLYRAVIGNQETLVVANEQHEIILGNEGIMATPIVDPESRRVLGMLKIEQMDFVSLSLSTVETFRAMAEWIGTALTNASNYQTVKSEAVVNPEHNLLTYNYFKRQSDYLAKLAKRANFDLSMLVVKVNDPKELGTTGRVSVARNVGEAVKSVLRSIDLAFDYQTDGEEYSILLPATSQAGAAIVRDKIAKSLDTQLGGRRDVSFNYIVQALHEVR